MSFWVCKGFERLLVLACGDEKWCAVFSSKYLGGWVGVCLYLYAKHKTIIICFIYILYNYVLTNKFWAGILLPQPLLLPKYALGRISVCLCEFRKGTF